MLFAELASGELLRLTLGRYLADSRTQPHLDSTEVWKLISGAQVWGIAVNVIAEHAGPLKASVASQRNGGARWPCCLSRPARGQEISTPVRDGQGWSEENQKVFSGIYRLGKEGFL
jgi:hypothetical protein